MAHISYVQPHSPFCAPGEDILRVDVDAIPEPIPATWPRDPHAPAYFRRQTASSLEGWKQKRRVYFANLIHLDRQLGVILDTLMETRRLDETYLILLADHGEMLGDHGFFGKEERHYDACVRVPLIIAGPGVRAGQKRDEMAQLEDICPTVLEMTGQRLPPVPRAGQYLKPDAEDAYALPGSWLLPLCRGETTRAWRQAAYCESYNALWSNDPGDWARTLRTRTHRYTVYANHGGDQLFDLREDPDEQDNRASDPAQAKIRQELRDALLETIILQDYPKTRRSLFAFGVH